MTVPLTKIYYKTLKCLILNTVIIIFTCEGAPTNLFNLFNEFFISNKLLESTTVIMRFFYFAITIF